LAAAKPVEPPNIVPRLAIFADWERCWRSLLHVLCFHGIRIADFMGRLCLVAANGDFVFSDDSGAVWNTVCAVHEGLRPV
jgi:hypothetical protein